MNILFVTSEYHPVAKAGGLADAVASLAQALRITGDSVQVVLPLYSSAHESGLSLERLPIPLGVPLGVHEEWVGIHTAELTGVTLFFLEHQELFQRGGIYGPEAARPWEDNLRRFALLSRGALQLALALDLRPDVIHSNDWPTALVSTYHHLFYRQTQLAAATTVFSIHNLGYQGIWPTGEALHLGASSRQLLETHLVTGSQINLVRSAVHVSDHVVTVSPRYAREILQQEFGFGLHEELRQRASHIDGILNGIDIDEWNPATDHLLTAPFSVDNLAGKGLCKQQLQHDLGLSVRDDLPLVGMVTRLTDQKGIGELFGPGHGSFHRICTELPLQFVILGSGERWCEDEIRHLTAQLHNAAAFIGYDHALAHRIEAGADFFLMPSVYEPCGLNQMYSMRYGTIPVVTRTGGLADTVDSATGIFIEDYSREGIFLALQQACHLWLYDKARLKRMRRAGMTRDFSWKHSAGEYRRLYQRYPEDDDGAGPPDAAMPDPSRIARRQS